MTSVHIGHRKRMKAKFALHGTDIFDTHELLEMLLYTVIPYRDTNPIAHELLARFDTLDGIAGAEETALATTPGIGERTAHFLSEVFAAGEEIFFPAEDAGREELTYRRAEEYLCSLLGNAHTYRTVMISLDNRLCRIATDVIADEDFGRGRADVRHFASLAIERHASAVILAHTHPYGPLYPSENDYVRGHLVGETLAVSSIPLLEHYILSGDKCIAFSSKDAAGSGRELLIGEPVPVLGRGRDEETLTRLLSVLPDIADAAGCASRMLCDGGSLRTLLTLPVEELTATYGMSEKNAVALKLVAALTSRRHTDRFPMGSVVTERQITDYLSALFAPLSEENVYLLLFDGAGRVLSAECVSRGSVNSSSITPRRLVDLAVRRNAASILLAHNHPNGYPRPSPEDIALTTVMQSAFASVGIRLREHYVVAGDRFGRVGEEAQTAGKNEYRFAASTEIGGNNENL